ncbi:hypothetical protein K8353_01665 [Burkholderia contaminans]|nr:hypothetical protein [Burkholderia contaminans]
MDTRFGRLLSDGATIVAESTFVARRSADIHISCFGMRISSFDRNTIYPDIHYARRDGLTRIRFE